MGPLGEIQPFQVMALISICRI